MTDERVMCDGVCEKLLPPEDLNDDGVCQECQLHRDIQRAEQMRDSAEDR